MTDVTQTEEPVAEPVVSDEAAMAAAQEMQARYIPPPPTKSILEILGLVPAPEPVEAVVPDPEETQKLADEYQARYEPVVYPSSVEVAQKCLDKVDDGPFMAAPGPEAQEAPPAVPAP